MWGWYGWAELHVTLRALMKLKGVDLILLWILTQQFISLLLLHFAEIFHQLIVEEKRVISITSQNSEESFWDTVERSSHSSFCPSSLFHWCHVDDWFICLLSVHTGSLLLRICHGLVRSMNPTLGNWKPKRHQNLKRETSLFFHSARTKKHLFRAEQHSSWLSWNSEKEEVGSTVLYVLDFLWLNI